MPGATVSALTSQARQAGVGIKFLAMRRLGMSYHRGIKGVAGTPFATQNAVRETPQMWCVCNTFPQCEYKTLKNQRFDLYSSAHSLFIDCGKDVSKVG